ncbi:MAG TPA: class I SAM-dependent methyltransferase [Phototrophicaceae bacterium]|nr:class I SAM-dependent methyltransferase [Phototrophicaceae bacterium]
METQDQPVRGRSGFIQRIFAWMYSRNDDDKLDRLVGAYKRRLLTGLTGTVLEIGPGTGANFPYFRRDIRWIGAEPNLFMHPHLQKAAQRAGITEVDIRPLTGEKLNLADNSLDAVVATHVLCSVDHQERVLQEIRRVLKPAGRFIFLEHVAAPPGTPLRQFQGFIRPVWAYCGDGCHLNRETWTAIENAGFTQVEIEHFRIPAPFVSPHIAGYAVK